MNETSPTFTSGFSRAIDTVQNWAVGFYTLLPNLIVGITLIILFGVFAYAIGRIIRKYFERKNRIDLGNILSDFGFWAVMLIGSLIGLTVILPSLNPADLLASLGIGSIAIGFAFKDILQNWFAGLLILLRLPFRRGDQISVEGVEGTVQRIEPRATVIRTYDGRDIVIPNTTIFTNMVTVNTSQPHRRVEIDLTVGYNYDVRTITSIIRAALDQIDEILKDPEPQIMCWDLGSTSLGIKIRWWIKSEQSQQTISRARAVQAIKEAFEVNDIDPTDPQLVFYQSANALPQEQKATKKKTKSKSSAKKEMVKPPTPPKFDSGKNDPERDQPKQDDKTKTLLTQTQANP
jgi:small-conductance mechanosensitive channel